MRPLRVAWLTTGRGPGSFGALEYATEAISSGLPVEIAVVFVNRDRGEFEATDRPSQAQTILVRTRGTSIFQFHLAPAKLGIGHRHRTRDRGRHIPHRR